MNVELQLPEINTHAGPGFYVAFEGPDGCGKSTIAEEVYQYFSTRDEKYSGKTLKVFENGYGETGAIIRKIMLDTRTDVQGEMFLSAADRSLHMSNVVIPALNEGKLVVSDRCFLSSLIYQSRDVHSVQEVYQVCKLIKNLVAPNIVFLINTDADERKRRLHLKRSGQGLDKIEEGDDSLYNHVNLGYTTAERWAPMFTVEIDGNRGLTAIVDEVIEKMKFVMTTALQNSRK